MAKVRCPKCITTTKVKKLICFLPNCPLKTQINFGTTSILDFKDYPKTPFTIVEELEIPVEPSYQSVGGFDYSMNGWE